MTDTDRTVLGIVALALLAGGCRAIEPDHHDPHNATGAWWQLRNVAAPAASKTADATTSQSAATVSNTLKIKDEDGHIHGRLTIRGDTSTPTDPWDAVVRGDRTGLDMIIEYHHPGMGQCQYDGNLDTNGFNYTGARYCAPTWDTVETFELFRTPLSRVSGYVRVENQPMDSVSLVLTMSATGFERDTITSADGSYVFYDVPADKYRNYTLTADLPTIDDLRWHGSTRRLAIRSGTPKRVDFNGWYVRTASILGTVTGNNSGLKDVTVSLSGAHLQDTVKRSTDGHGQYSYTGLRAGTYEVGISGFDTTKWAFPYTDTTAVLSTGESRPISFNGTAK